MLTFSALGQDFSLDTKPTTTASRLKRVASRMTTATATEANASGCLPGDAMSEFGCITPKVLGPGASAVNQYYVCPPYSTPYDQMWCLRQAVPKGFEYRPAGQAFEQHVEQQPQPEPQPEISQQAVEPEQTVMTMYVCADGTRVGDPSLCPITPADGTEPSPGMQTEPVPEIDYRPPIVQPIVADERKRWTKWATIGAVVIGAGVVAAVLRR